MIEAIADSTKLLYKDSARNNLFDSDIDDKIQWRKFKKGTKVFIYSLNEDFKDKMK